MDPINFSTWPNGEFVENLSPFADFLNVTVNQFVSVQPLRMLNNCNSGRSKIFFATISTIAVGPC